MQHYRFIEDLDLQKTWVTIGSFDGIHSGHQYLIRQMVQDAHENDAASVVITFFPHPAVYLHKIKDPFYLTSPNEKLGYLQNLGVDYVVTLEFNQDLGSMHASNFIEKLSRHLGMQKLWVGQGFALGKGREGNTSYLQKISHAYHYQLNIIDPIQIGERNISSTLIRDLLRKGSVSEVKQFLGRNYSITGNIIHGDQRGRVLGFPTANLETTKQRLIPANGIYATRAKLKNKTYLSVTNIGIRPTFQTEDPTPRVETHILDFDQDVYNAELTVEFIEYLRPEIRYTNLQDLLDQIHLDVEKSREVLTHES